MSHFIYPVFLPLLVFVIGHIARCAPSSKFKKTTKIQVKIDQLILSPLLN